MAADSRSWFLTGVIALCLINDVASRIIEAPENALAVLCEDDRPRMNCTSNTNDQIAWTYDGNTVINARCLETTPVFVGESTTSQECDIIALLDEARTVDNIRTISGPYGCTDQTNDGVTETSMVIMLDMWCGVVNNCPVKEDDSVTVGCFAQYDWLTFLQQYLPLVSINVSLQFIEDPNTFVGPQRPQWRSPEPGPQSGPPSELLSTTYTIRNVKAGERINATCMVEFSFERSPTAYSNRNAHAANPLRHICSVNQLVSYCPRNVRIEPTNGAQAYQNLTCYADSYPEAEYIWIDHINNNNVTVGQTFTLKPGQYSLTCRATVNNATCTQGNPVCRQNGSYAWKQGNDPNVPFQLFNCTAPNYAGSCEATATTYGIAGEATAGPVTQGSLQTEATAGPVTQGSLQTEATPGTLLTGEIVAIAVAAFAVLCVAALIIIAVVYCSRRRKKAGRRQSIELNRETPANSTDMTYSGTPTPRTDQSNVNAGYEPLAYAPGRALSANDRVDAEEYEEIRDPDYLDVVNDYD